MGFGRLLEVEMLKKCTPLWRKAHLEVKNHCPWQFCKRAVLKTTCLFKVDFPLFWETSGNSRGTGWAPRPFRMGLKKYGDGSKLSTKSGWFDTANDNLSGWVRITIQTSASAKLPSLVDELLNFRFSRACGEESLPKRSISFSPQHQSNQVWNNWPLIVDWLWGIKNLLLGDGVTHISYFIISNHFSENATGLWKNLWHSLATFQVKGSIENLRKQLKAKGAVVSVWHVFRAGKILVWVHVLWQWWAGNVDLS